MPAEKQFSSPASAPSSEQGAPVFGEALSLPAPTIGARYCILHGLTLNECAGRLFREALYPAARCFRAPLALLPRYFEADWSFVHGVARAGSMAQFDAEVQNFADDGGNRGVLRRVLKFRVSVRRLRRIARELLSAAPPAPGNDEPLVAAIDLTAPVSPRPLSARRRPEFRLLQSAARKPPPPSDPAPPPDRPAQFVSRPVRTEAELHSELDRLKHEREALKTALRIMIDPPPNQPR